MTNIIIPIAISVIIAAVLLIIKRCETKISKTRIYAILAVVALIITGILYFLLR